MRQLTEQRRELLRAAAALVEYRNREAINAWLREQGQPEADIHEWARFRAQELGTTEDHFPPVGPAEIIQFPPRKAA